MPQTSTGIGGFGKAEGGELSKLDTRLADFSKQRMDSGDNPPARNKTTEGRERQREHERRVSIRSREQPFQANRKRFRLGPTCAAGWWPWWMVRSAPPTASSLLAPPRSAPGSRSPCSFGRGERDGGYETSTLPTITPDSKSGQRRGASTHTARTFLSPVQKYFWRVADCQRSTCNSWDPWARRRLKHSLLHCPPEG